MEGNINLNNNSDGDDSNLPQDLTNTLNSTITSTAEVLKNLLLIIDSEVNDVEMKESAKKLVKDLNLELKDTITNFNQSSIKDYVSSFGSEEE
jgi:hypothetical protein